jgi:hypothetical protein
MESSAAGNVHDAGRKVQRTIQLNITFALRVDDQPILPWKWRISSEF